MGERLEPCIYTINTQDVCEEWMFSWYFNGSSINETSPAPTTHGLYTCQAEYLGYIIEILTVNVTDVDVTGEKDYLPRRALGSYLYTLSDLPAYLSPKCV